MGLWDVFWAANMFRLRRWNPGEASSSTSEVEFHTRGFERLAATAWGCSWARLPLPLAFHDFLGFRREHSWKRYKYIILNEMTIWWTLFCSWMYWGTKTWWRIAQVSAVVHLSQRCSMFRLVQSSQKSTPLMHISPLFPSICSAALFIDEVAFKHNAQEPPYSEAALAAKLHKRLLLSSGPPGRVLLLLLKQLLSQQMLDTSTPPVLLQVEKL